MQKIHANMSGGSLAKFREPPEDLISAVCIVASRLHFGVINTKIKNDNYVVKGYLIKDLGTKKNFIRIDVYKKENK